VALGLTNAAVALMPALMPAAQVLGPSSSVAAPAQHRKRRIDSQTKPLRTLRATITMALGADAPKRVGSCWPDGATGPVDRHREDATGPSGNGDRSQATFDRAAQPAWAACEAPSTLR
jgi:hypothetical protein